MSDSTHNREDQSVTSVIGRVVRSDDYNDDSGSRLETKTDGADVVAISAGGTDHDLALTADGQIIAAGDKRVSEILTKTAGRRIVAISAGFRHDLALTADGLVVGAGDDQSKQVSGIVAETEGKRIVAIAAGDEKSVALTAEGSVIAVGDDYYKDVSGIVAKTAGKRIAAIAAGPITNLALTADGQVVAAGKDDYKQVSGIVAETEGKRIVAIAAGTDHSLALTADGDVIAAGRDEGGEVSGIVTNTKGKRIVAIAAGDGSSMALTAGGHLVAAGRGSRLVAKTGGKRVTAVSIAPHHSLALVQQVPVMSGHAAVADLPQVTAPHELVSSDIGRSAVAVSQHTTAAHGELINGHGQSVQISSGASELHGTVSGDNRTVHGTVTAATAQAGTNAPLVVAATAMDLDVTVTAAHGGTVTPAVRLTFQELQINGQAQPTTPAPNTTIALDGGAKVVLNRQQASRDGIDVTAIALYDSTGEVMRLGHISAHLPTDDVQATSE
ncbi:choice-of-anchor P family protein [Nocardia sp. NPDC057455]|uniref:choice-of-anchor P family protein n=1 Tax=Nocardia sp. NPDC057455 TaxID=3346138 RepID=UPI003670FD18